MENVIEEHIDTTDIAQMIPLSSISDQSEVDESCFVALHIGAGYHSQAKSAVYRKLCDDVCSEVMQLLKQGYAARDAVAAAVTLLEVF